jgi:hypothetical protein
MSLGSSALVKLESTGTLASYSSVLVDAKHGFPLSGLGNMQAIYWIDQAGLALSMLLLSPESKSYVFSVLKRIRPQASSIALDKHCWNQVVEHNAGEKVTVP